jgi:hypothetical protein
VGEGSTEPPFRADLDGGSGAALHAERMRDGRVALAARGPDGEWAAGEAQVLSPAAAAALAGWLAATVQREWMGTVRQHLDSQLATADALYGEERDGLRRLGHQLLDQVPPGLLARAMVLLANSIGPDARERLVAALNRTRDFSEDLILRRRLAEEGDAFAYVVAAAAVFDALDPDAPEYPGRAGPDGA